MLPSCARVCARPLGQPRGWGQERRAEAGAEPSPATTPLAGGALGIWDAPHRVGLIFLPVTVTLKPPVSLWVSGDKSMCSGISC